MAVVGAGPTGLSCAIELKRRGVSAVVFDKGCVVNSLYHYPTHMTFFTTPELLEIGDLPMTAVREKPTRAEALKYYRRVADHYRLDIRQYERVDDIQGADSGFSVATTNRKGAAGDYEARKIIIATGYYDVPVLMNVPGEDLPKVLHYYKEPHPFYDCDVTVIGAKNSAAIAALEVYRAGGRVTLIYRDAKLSDRIKYWILPDIQNRVKNGEIKAYAETSVLAITEDTIRVATPDGEKVLKNDFVLAMTGYSPDLAFLRRCGITLEPETQKPRTNAETLESERPGVYLAGVIVAGMHTNEIFIENGRFHGIAIADDIASKLNTA
ncbi:MAG: YpdA family putative bacillithiol disulfide reductase [Bryobacterales bacterium]|nr:YpdA family putative bacillithiol disulfide reductase [Bryobacterales bacterium]MDE0294782.1 YpdA family putative bacillithiol disulfide reductase [Bryobacterales bacterium]MDE0434567.1 YpdA family putative bacillithiol disulfide reductase [Bryobacterales bacterium]